MAGRARYARGFLFPELLALALLLQMAAFAHAQRGIDSTPESEVPEAGFGSITFSVGVCPPDVVAFPDTMQADGLPDCNGAGLAGGEPPLVGGVVSLISLDSGEVVTLPLDGSGVASTNVPGNSTYAASFWLDGLELSSRSVCGSMQSGLAGAIETGLGVAVDEDLSCQVLVLSPDAAAASGRGSISITLQSCPAGTNPDLLLTGDGVLDCNGDPSVSEAVPAADVEVIIRNVTTGETFPATTDADGTASVVVPSGSYAAALAGGDADAEWASVCSGIDSTGDPLGLIGSIGESSAPVMVADGDAITCNGLIVLEDASLPTPPPANSAVVQLTVLDCPPDFDWEPVVNAGAPSNSTIEAVNDHYASSCIGQYPEPLTYSVITANGEIGNEAILPAGALLTQVVEEGGRLSLGADRIDIDFWADCSAPDAYGRTSGSGTFDNPAGISLKVPVGFSGIQIDCLVYVNHAAGTITHVIHGCDGFDVQINSLSCIPTVIPPQQFDAGSIWTDLPWSGTSWDSTSRVYASARWYVRDGFNRLWSSGETSEGALTLEASVPFGVLEVGVGNLDSYSSHFVLLACGTEATGWSTQVVTQLDPDNPYQWGNGEVAIGIDGAPDHVTCHWYVDVSAMS